MRLKFLLPTVLVAIAAGILAFNAISKNRTSSESILNKELTNKILGTGDKEGLYNIEDNRDEITALIMSQVLETLHYSPQTIDKEFADKVFDKYIDLLDHEKKFFFNEDIDYLKKHEENLVDQIKGTAPLQFYRDADSLLRIRIDAAKELYPKILDQPFDFSAKDSLLLEVKKQNFPKDEEEFNDKWEKQLKYRTLSKLVDLKKTQKNAVDTAAIKKKSIADLQKEARASIKKSLDLFFDRMASHYTSDVRFGDFLNVVAGVMDPHTNYFSPKDSHYFDEQMSGTFFGIGALLSQSDYYVKIESIVTGGPAWKQGDLKAGDLIMKVAEGDEEPLDMTGYTTEDAVKVIRGKKGTTIKLTVKHIDETIETIAIERDEVKVDAIFAHSYVIDQDGKQIGLVVLPEFYFNPRGMTGPGSSAYDVRQEIEKLKGHGVEGIILDLRFNGGGSLGDAIDMAGLFIEKGPIVQVRSGDGQKQVLKDRDKDVVYSGPLAIMVNEYSASASEILSAAMQDYKRAVVIGSSRTFGKGTVQRKLDLQNVLDPKQKDAFGDIGALKLTIQKFYRINGGSTQIKGVASDIVLPDPYYEVTESESSNALPWDSISPADYSVWTTPPDLDYLKEKSKVRMAQSEAFNKIQKSIDIIKRIGDEKKISLNLDEYEARQDSNSHALKVVNQSDSLHVFLEIEDLSATKDETGEVDSMMINRNKEMLKGYKQDPYLREAVSVVEDMISAPSLERKGLTHSKEKKE